MGKWEMARLSDVALFNMGQSPSSESYNDEGEGVPFFQGKTDFGLAHPTVRMYCTDPKKMAKKNDILISVRAPVGAVNIATETCCIGRGLAAISPQKHKSIHKYLYYYLQYKENDIASMGVGSTFKAISKKDLDVIELPLPPLPVQQKIADILDRASALIEKRKAQIAKLDLLVRAKFVAMFGDPVGNPMGWKTSRLGDCGSLKNGMNFSQNDSGYSVRCLGVGDFKNLYTIESLTSISKISLSAKPTNEYLLRDSDIVFVRSNGNKELVGRSVEMFPGEDELTFSGFCIRYRNENPNLLTIYLNNALHLPALRAALLSGGRGANIQNVNQQTLASLVIPVPPLSLQTHFATFVAYVEMQKERKKKGLELMELNYKALMQRSFRGVLFS